MMKERDDFELLAPLLDQGPKAAKYVMYVALGIAVLYIAGKVMHVGAGTVRAYKDLNAACKGI